MSDAEWFKNLVEDFGRKRKLTPRRLKDGPTEFHAQFGMSRGQPLYEIRVDVARDSASYLNNNVPYGSVLRVFSAGMEEQFSPFDDNTSAVKTPLDLPTWLARQLR